VTWCFNKKETPMALNVDQMRQKKKTKQLTSKHKGGTLCSTVVTNIKNYCLFALNKNPEVETYLLWQYCR
jgi:hypothetical protein